MFELASTTLAGCYEVRTKILNDERGCFVKFFHSPEFQKLGLETNFQEDYYTVSQARVLRGLHFQRPEMDHAKLVFCVSGSVLDAVVDLRLNSLTYGKTYSLELSASKGNGLYIPKGFAHGFAVPSGEAIMLYKVSTVYSPTHDDGILWSSLDISWPTKDPILSLRDSSFVPFDKFISPFKL